MRGCRAFTDDEIEKIKKYYERRIGSDYDKYNLELRNYTIFMFSLYVGFRISETLSLTINDVYQFNRVSTNIYLQKRNTKGQRQGRVGIINEHCQKLLNNYLIHYQMIPKTIEEGNRALFFSRKGNQLTSRQVGRIYDTMFTALEFDGNLGTHTTRKSFAAKMYKALNNSVLDLKQALGHSSLNSTCSYINPDSEKVQQAQNKLEY